MLHEVMHLWNYDHNKGTANWLDAICFDWDTHGRQENPNIAFHEGFAQYAAEELLFHIWGQDKRLPYNRRFLHQKGLYDLDMIERNDFGVTSGLHLLTARGRFGFYKFLFGTSDTYPDNQKNGSTVSIASMIPTGCPNSPGLDFWDVLRAFEEHPGAGWDTEWQVGKAEYGLVRFYERCCDIYDSFNKSTRDLLLDLLAPSKTVEPREACAGWNGGELPRTS